MTMAEIGGMIKVEIQSKKWIKPSASTPSHLHKLNISSIDQLAPPIFVRPIFHFDIGSECPATRLSRIKESLSKVLTLYYPFSGRYDEDESAISCEDQGVEFVVATLDCNLNDISDHHHKLLLSGLDTLHSTNVDFASTPVVLVQVNVFKCGGLAIGLGFFHKLGDMFTISTFMHAWATVSRLGRLDHQVVRMTFNTSSLLPPLDVMNPSNPKKKPSETSKKPQPKHTIRRYIFTGELIAKLKSAISEESELNTTHNYTRVELVAALITRNLINIDHSKGDQPKGLVIATPMNFRTRTALSIEKNSCGNLCIPVTATQDHLETSESWELRELARLIRDSIKNVASEIREVHDWSELWHTVEKGVGKFYDARKEGESVIMVMISSWLRFGLYEVDFGWGKPSLVSTTPLPYGFVWLMDCKSEAGGIEAWVNLEEEDAERFQHQPDILEYTLLLS